MAAEAMGNEAGAASIMQDPGALNLAEEALALCRSLNSVPSTTEARLLFILGVAHGQRHDYSKSIAALEESVAIGTSIQDLRQLSMVYGNLSVNYQELGQLAQAARYAHRAMAIYETLRDKRMIAMSENNLAILLFVQGDHANAFRHGERSLSLFEELGLETEKAHILMTMAELELARANVASASRYAAAARDVAERMGETANVGEARVWLGRIADAVGDSDAADAEFGAAFQLFDLVNAQERKARNRAVYAELLEGRGDLVGANRQLKMALAALGTTSTSVVDARTATA